MTAANRIRATYLVDLLDAVMERMGFPPPLDPAICPHPPAEQWVLRPGRLACGDCGRVINHGAGAAGGSEATPKGGS